MHIIQKNLTEVADEWNSHLISRSHNTHIARGIPDVLYLTPHIGGIIRMLNTVW